MDNLKKIEWEVLDATADDIENLEQIYRCVVFEYSLGFNTKILEGDAKTPIS